MTEYEHPVTVCILYLLLLPAASLGRTTESPVCQDNGCESHYGGDAECVNVRHGNWSRIGREYVLGTVDKEGLCHSQHQTEDCCRCLPIRTTTTTTTSTTTSTSTTTTTTSTPPGGCTDVHGSCRAAFNGSGSCIDVRQDDLTYIDIDVDPLDGHCGAGPDKCCECFKLKTGGSLMAIGGTNRISGGLRNQLSSAEVLTTSCDFPLPEGRQGHISVTTTDGKILVCGGYTPFGYTRSCLQFNSQSKTWEHHSNMLNRNPFQASAVVLKHGVYILGGEFSKSSSEFLATGSTVWTQGPDIPGPGVRDSCAVTLSDTEFVILGGRDDRNQALVYSTTKNKWTYWPRIIDGETRHSCVRLGDKILMAGGSNTKKTIMFDIKTGSAREVGSLKYPRRRAAMELYGGTAVILGGYGYPKFRSDGEMWNIDTETWEEANISLNIGRYVFSLVATSKEIECD